MHPRTFFMLVIGFVGGLVASACGTAATCSPATCGGCCDTAGKCQSGATPDFCGSAGVACAHCGTGTICQQSECRAASNGGGGGTTGGGSGGGATGGGTGGGTTGGGTGTGGGTTGGGTGTGGGGGCRMITMLATTQQNLGLAEYRSFTNPANGHYNYAGWIYLQSGGNPDSFRMEMVYPGNVFPTFPYTETFSTSTRYGNCKACAIYYESCDPNTTACQREFLAQSGSMTVTRADQASVGRTQGSASNLRFTEWDLASDMPSGTGCIIVNTVGPWDIGWNADGGAIP